MLNGPVQSWAKLGGWAQRARESAARLAQVVGAPFVNKKAGKTSTIYIYDFIGKDLMGTGISPMEIIGAIEEAKGSSKLDIRINSGGGYISDGIAIFNAIRAFEGERVVQVDGVAASIASIVALAGDKVITNEGAQWMIHDPMGGLMSFGTADEIEEDSRKTVTALRKARENLLDIYASNTGQPIAKLSAWMASETWMTAAEAFDRGFTDEIACDPEKETKERLAAVLPPATPRAVAELARAQARVISERFSGASPGKPGQPGAVKQ